MVTCRTTSPCGVATRMAIGARNASGVTKRTPLLSAVGVSIWVWRTVSVSARAVES